MVTAAEDENQSAILRAEGYALALGKVFEVAKTLDTNTMSLQYLEALRQLGISSATMFVLPMEFTSFLKPFLGQQPAPPQK